MVIRYNNIFRSKAPQILPKMGFFGLKTKPSGNPAAAGSIKLFDNFWFDEKTG
jgi:hypothetical protein